MLKYDVHQQQVYCFTFFRSGVLCKISEPYSATSTMSELSLTEAGNALSRIRIKNYINYIFTPFEPQNCTHRTIYILQNLSIITHPIFIKFYSLLIIYFTLNYLYYNDCSLFYFQKYEFFYISQNKLYDSVFPGFQVNSF